VGVGADNTAVFDTPLPTVTPQTLNFVGTLVNGYDAVEGDVMALVVDKKLGLAIDEIVYVEADGITRGPYQVYNINAQGTGDMMRRQGPGFATVYDKNIQPARALRVVRNAYVTWSVTPYYEGGPTAADPYRWRGWYALPRPGQKLTALYFDVVMPGGIAWITDKGDYNSLGVTLLIEIQEIDDNSEPINTPSRLTRTITGATSSPRRVTFDIPSTRPGRYRVRVARENNRDQRASKEISVTQLAGLRARVYHPPGTTAYENATLIAMRFVANAGLAAASGRRIRVECTRRLPDVNGAGLSATSNPAAAVRDLYTEANYGAGRPVSEFDTTTFARLAPQWATTPGFNGIFDQPTTVIEAAQAVLAPVAAMPLPIGSTLSVSQDCPRPYAYVFGPDTIVSDTMALGYNFDGLDEPDCLEVTYNDPATFVEMRVFYPVQGIKPETVELFGCTNAAQATAWARLRWQEKAANRKTCQFELEGEGYLLEPLTHFGLVVPSITRGDAGMVTAYAYPNVSLDTPFPSGAGVIHFKQWDGTIGPAYPVTRGASAFEVTLTGTTQPPAGTVHPGNAAGDGTRWVAGYPTELFFEFSVTNLEPAGPMRVRVTGTQYTDAKFTGTFVETWTP
jgi:hypothetical protein